MRISLLSAGALLLQACHVQSKAVFAHFMVGNTPTWELSDWKNNIQLAVDAHIDAFALNIANGWYANDASLALAFEAAASLDFQLFFSFDYAGNGSWAQADVISLITQYGSSGAYFQYSGGPFVSTFEGPGNADDWVQIKAQTGCFFIPDWSSLGAIPAAAAADGVVDGLFSWAGWPWGDKNMTTFVDASYMQTLNASGKPYMMPVSPWFYTNMPGYDKNWLWRGDDTWYQRWQQVWYLQPEFVEIISWNDFGESHYIGPLDNSSFDAFTVGQAPFNYAKDMPHDGWRDLLPFMIDTYKSGERVLITDERLVVWYRTSLAGDCSSGNTTGNTASQLQLEFAPEDVSQDRLFFTALLSDYADVKVMIDAEVHDAEWDFLPPGPLVTGGPGLYHGSIALTHLERVEVIITRDDVDIFSVFGGKDVSPDNCVNGLTNWNAWVASGSAGKLGQSVYPAFDLNLQTCVAGYSVDAFTDLCEFTCAWGYCPVGACVCTNMGIILDQLNQTGAVGYPANGDSNYAGLCSFACAAGYCPSDYCSPEVQASYVPTSSPFDPPTCTGGTSDNGNFLGLCSYGCNFGFCPRNSCTCNSKGPLIQPPAQTSTTGISLVGPDSDLCNFACTRGYCPSGTCAQFVGRYPDNTCNPSQKSYIAEEMAFAIEIATYAQQHLQEGVYYDTLFAEELRSTTGFASNAASVYQKVAAILSGSEKDFDLKITCDDSSSWCGNGKYLAHMSDGEQRVNFCNAFFGTDKVESTDYRLYLCEQPNHGLTLEDFLRTTSSIILHETTHTSAAMWSNTPSLDYAYGYDACAKLAKGTFDRSCSKWWLDKPKNPLCSPDNDPTAEGVCPPEYSANNADTYALVAAGLWYTHKCEEDIKLTSAASTATGDNSCPPDGDWLIVDTDEIPVVEGYVHFGDSYAAGMGTGVTSRDPCRVGSNNYGRLLYQWFDDETIPFETLACSGDTTTGLLKQIDSWKAPDVATLGTLTMGGNDLDFSNMVYYCVLTPNGFYSASGNREYCLDYEAKAKALMEDGSDAGLTAKLADAYLKILTKSARTDFHLYVTGYPGFFNYDTTDCDLSSFNYWHPGYDQTWWDTSPWVLSRLVLLTQDLRSELDALVDQLNGVIQQAINDANAQHGGAQIHYVNVQPYFDTHRWCENADASWHEPDPSVDSTWFFLSAWDDVMLTTDTITTTEEEATEMSTLMSQGSIVLPDADTCTGALGTDPDPYAVAMCRAAIEVADNSTSLQATNLAQANEDIANGNFSSQAIARYLPTKQVKTFHPRSPGMLAFRNAIINAM